MRNLWHPALGVLLPVVLQQTLFDHLRHFNLFMRWLPALGVLLPVVLQQTLSAAKLLVGYEEPVAPCSRSSLYPGSSTSASLFTYSAVMRITRACGLQGGTSGGQKCDIQLTLHVTPTMLGNYHAELQLPSPWLVSWFVMLIFIAQSCTACRPSLVPRPLPDLITQPWRKIGRRPGTNTARTNTASRTGNGGLDFIMMATCPRNMRPVPASDRVCLGVLPTVTDFASTKSLTKGV